MTQTIDCERTGSPTHLPRVTVITIVRNGRAHIERAVQSVLRQSFPSIEYVVKDGVSTDGTLEALEPFRGVARIESRADRGIADAWNQALALATGKYVALLNADDEFEPTLIQEAVEALEKSGADLAFGDVELRAEPMTATGRRIHGRWRVNRLWQGTGFLHPGVVVRRDAFERYGVFRDDLRYAMDVDWILRLHRGGARFVKHRGVCRMSVGGISNTQWRRARREHLRVLSDNGLPWWQRVLAWGWFGALLLKKSLARAPNHEK